MDILVPTSTLETIGGFITDIFGSFSMIIVLVFSLLLVFAILDWLVGTYYTIKYKTEYQATTQKTGLSAIVKSYKATMKNTQDDIEAGYFIRGNIPQETFIKMLVDKGYSYRKAKKLSGGIYYKKDEEKNTDIVAKK